MSEITEELAAQIERDIEAQNFKTYQDSDGNIHWIPASKPPKDGWVELPDMDEEPEVDPNYQIPWLARRQNAYPFIGDQLNALFDDVKAGKFGDAAKAGDWYTMVNQVKIDIPKDDT